MITYERDLEIDVDGNELHDAIIFDRMESDLIIKVFERALNCWSNPPRELLDVLDQMKERK
jgi:hypothetical protein